MARQPVLFTQRLILRPLVLADAEAIQQQFAHWDVVRSRPMARVATWNRSPCRPWHGANSGIGQSASRVRRSS